jgi:hypothetical protein
LNAIDSKRIKEKKENFRANDIKEKQKQKTKRLMKKEIVARGQRGQAVMSVVLFVAFVNQEEEGV